MNSSFYDFQDSLEYTTFICDVLMACITCVGLTGNIMICIVIYKTKALQTYINATLVCSALVDILGCSFLLPVRIYVYTFPLAHFDILQICCQLGIFLRNLCDCVKLFMLTVGSFERYRAVVHPFNKEGRLRRTVVLMSLSWFIAVIFSSFSVVFFNDTTLYVHCLIEPNTFSEQWGKNDVFLILPLGLICLSAIFVFYTLILVTLFKHSSIMKKRLNKVNKIHPVEQKHVKEKDDKEYVPKMTIPTIIIEPLTSSQHDIKHRISGNSINNETEWADIGNASCIPLETDEENANKVNIRTRHTDTGVHNSYSECDAEYKSNVTDVKREYSSNDVNQTYSKDSKTNVSVSKDMDIRDIGKKCVDARKEPNCEHIELNSTENTASGSTAMYVINVKQSNVGSKLSNLSEKNNKKTKTENFLTTTLDTNVYVGKAFYVGNIKTKVENSENAESNVQNTDTNMLKIKCVHNNSIRESKNDIGSQKHHENEEGDEMLVTKETALGKEKLDKKLTSRKDKSEIEVAKESKHKDDSLKVNNAKTKDMQTHNNDHSNDIANTSHRKYSTTVQVFDIEGKVKIGKTNNKAVVGAVCVMNTKNRIQGRRKVEIKAAKRILILIGTFILCWLPLPVFVLCVGEQAKLNLLEVQLVIILGTVNGLNMAINPIQYGFCNRQIHSAFKNIYNECWTHHY